MYSIDNTIEVAASAESICSLMTTREGFRAWLADDTTVDSAGRFTFAFAQPTESRDVTFTLDRANDRGIVMTCVDQKNNLDWLGTVLTITVHKLEGGKCRIDLVHSGYRSKNEVYERCIPAWAHFISSLAKCAVTGMGEPFKATQQAVAS